jgi:hypothetical protein
VVNDIILSNAPISLLPPLLLAGNCGNGPNIALLPQELILRHVSTPSDLADILNWQCGLDINPEVLKVTEVGKGMYMYVRLLNCDCMSML